MLPGRRIVNTRLRLVLRRLRAAAPDAQIVLVGYPNFMPYEGRACQQSLFAFAPTDVLWLHNEISALNRLLRSVAAEASSDASKPVLFIDPSAPFFGHDVCHKGASWFNGVTLRGIVLGHKVEFFHPTAKGQSAIASVVFDAIRSSE